MSILTVYIYNVVRTLLCACIIKVDAK
jgi:hypothetical protein